MIAPDRDEEASRLRGVVGFCTPIGPSGARLRSFCFSSGGNRIPAGADAPFPWGERQISPGANRGFPRALRRFAIAFGDSPGGNARWHLFGEPQRRGNAISRAQTDSTPRGDARGSRGKARTLETELPEAAKASARHDFATFRYPHGFATAQT